MDTQMSSIFLCFLNQGFEILNPTDPLSNIRIIQMPRIMAFTTIPFQQYTLSETICV